MQKLKKHISIFLLAVFLFPQGVSAMHYFVVKHHSYDNSKLVFKKSNEFEYHTCNYHLNGFSPLILSEEKLKKSHKNETLRNRIKHCCLENYVQQPNFNFLLRGPPFKSNFPYKK